MERKQEMAIWIEEFRAARLNQKKGDLSNMILKLQPAFSQKVDFIIQDQLRMNRDVKGDIEIFYLCRLLSSDYTESYESVLGISNESLFSDKRRSEIYWCPRHIYQDLNNAVKEVERLLRTKFVRIETHELLYLKQLLLSDDWEILKECFSVLAQEQLPVLKDSFLDFKPELKIMSGYYMEQLQLQSIHCLPQPYDEADGDV